MEPLVLHWHIQVIVINVKLSMRPACLSLYCQNTLGVTIWTKFPKHWQSNLADPLQGRVSLKSKHPLGLFCSESMNSFSLLPFTSGSSDWLLQLPRRKGTKQLSSIWILIPADREKTACQSAPPTTSIHRLQITRQLLLCEASEEACNTMGTS